MKGIAFLVATVLADKIREYARWLLGLWHELFQRVAQDAAEQGREHSGAPDRQLRAGYDRTLTTRRTHSYSHPQRNEREHQRSRGGYGR
jgi:hypothetical protein